MSAAPAGPAAPAAPDVRPAPTRRGVLTRRAQLIAGAAVVYNVVEAVVAISAGAASSSVALVAFGLDSVVEVSSGLVILWQFRHPLPETRERRALRLIGVSFLALAAYVTVESVRQLTGAEDAAGSGVGVALAAVSLAVMPFLSWAQRRTGRELGSGSVVADSTQTLLCTYLSAVVLVGLALNAVLGWGWADPLAGLVVAAVAVREGLAAWRGDACCDAPTATGSPTLGVDAGDPAACCDDGCCASTDLTPTRREATSRQGRSGGGKP